MFPGKASDGPLMSSRFSSLGEVQSSVSSSRDVYHSGSEDLGRKMLTELLPKESSRIYSSRLLDNQYTEHAESSIVQDEKDKPVSLDRGGASKAEAFDPSDVSSKGDEMVNSSNERSEGVCLPKLKEQGILLRGPIVLLHLLLIVEVLLQLLLVEDCHLVHLLVHCHQRSHL